MDLKGFVVTRFGAELIVMTETGESQRCASKRCLDYVVCGDVVHWHHTPGGDCVVTAVCERTNELARTDKRGRRRVVAANVEQLLVVTAHTPGPDWKLVDRYIASAENLDAGCAVIYNKVDLGPADAETDQKLSLYADLGYPVIRCSARNRLRTGELGDLVTGSTSIFVGQSGTGKSSLIKSLHPHLGIRIGTLGKSGRHGRHTTSRSALFHTAAGGRLIDSPGVRSFDPPLGTREQVERGFREITPCIGHCRFHNCSHTVEPGCAVLRAADEGRIQADRLASYQECLTTLRKPG